MTRFAKYRELERRTGLLTKLLNYDFSWGDKLTHYVHEQRRYGILNKKYRELRRRNYDVRTD